MSLIDEKEFKAIFGPQSTRDIELIARAKTDVAMNRKPQSADVVYVDAYLEAEQTRQMIENAHSQIKEAL